MSFRKKSAADEPTSAAESTPGKVGGKGRPTPKRREQEAKRLHPLVPPDREAARKTARAAQRQARDEAFRRQQEALRTGDERYLPARDKGPARRFARDWIDARFCIGQFTLPLMLLMMVASFVLASFLPRLAVWSLAAIYVLFFVAFADSLFAARQVGRALEAKFSVAQIPRFTRFYAFSRSFMPRRLRAPRPQVGRGQFPS